MAKKESTPNKKDKKEDVKKLSDSEAKKVILEYMQSQNRPYNSTMVQENLRGAVTKTQATKILAALAEQGLLTEKEFGKQKVYWNNQNTIELPNEQELKKLQAETTELENELVELRKLSKSSESELRFLQTAPSNKEATQEIQRLSLENSDLSKKLEKCKSGGISTENKIEIEKRYQSSKSEWKRRKRLCLEILSEISEASGKKPKDLIKKIGLDLDEDAKVDPDQDLTSNFLKNIKQ